MGNWYENTNTDSLGRLEPGFYVSKIINVTMTKDKPCNDGVLRTLFEIWYDIIEGSQAGYFKKKADTYGGKHSGKFFVYYPAIDGNGNLVTEKDAMFAKTLKTLMSAIENSAENNYWKFNPMWSCEEVRMRLRDRIFVAVLREEEFLHNGKILTAVKYYYPRSTKAYRNGECSKIPELKKLAPMGMNKNYSNPFTAIDDNTNIINTGGVGFETPNTRFPDNGKNPYNINDNDLPF